MKRSAKRILSAVAAGLGCVLIGAYLGANHAYDRIGRELPQMIEAAGCSPDYGGAPLSAGRP